MSADRAVFSIDTGVLIEAAKRYYAPDICPPFWRILRQEFTSGRVRSCDEVRRELLASEPIVEDFTRSLDKAYFPDADAEVASRYSEIVVWVDSLRLPPRQLKTTGVERFAASADGWLVADAAISGSVVVTTEVAAPNSRNDIKIPDICTEFGVESINGFDMLRRLNAQV